MASTAETAAINGSSYVKKLPGFLGAGLFLLLASLCLPQRTEAASFYFSPASGSYKIGQTITVGVNAASTDQAANAFQATIHFPTDKLQLTSLSKTGSVMSLWVQEPSYSNGGGTADFAGIILNPGYTGGRAKMLILTFKVVAVGTANLSFSSASILANDGQGTNILTGLGTATFNLQTSPTGNEAGKATSPVEQAGTPLPPEVSSPTHPDPNQWYSNSNPKLVWNLPADVDGISTALDKDVNGNPGTKAEGLSATKSYTNVADGEWYFHVRLHNKHGWGGVSHFRVRIDTKPPQPFDINFVNPSQTDNPQPLVYLNATDTLSGIDHYQLLVIDGVLVDVKPSDISLAKPYQLPAQTPGKHSLVVRAYDRAGNTESSITEFAVTSLVPPVFNDYPKSLTEGDILAVRGKTYPNATLTVWLQYEGEDAVSENVQSGYLGEFTYVASGRVKNGIYKLWAEVTDGRGARSGSSEHITIPVTKPQLQVWGEQTLSILIIVTQFIALIVLIILLLLYAKRKLDAFKKRIRRDVGDAEVTIETALHNLHSNAVLQVTMLVEARKRRELTPEENIIFDQLKKQVEEVEKIVKEKLDDLEEDVR